MSDLAVFIIGALVFSITVYGSIIGAGLALTRHEIENDPELRKRAGDGKLSTRKMLGIKY